MINRRLRKLTLITASAFISLVGLSLSGCSTTSESFDCKAGHGVGCRSISEVNRMVDRGHLGSLAESDVPLTKDRQSKLPFEPASPSTPVISTGPLPVEYPGNLVVHRMPEEYLRVWVAPYQDRYGNFHEGSVVHTVLKPGYWHIKPSSQKTKGSPENETTDSNPEERD